MCLFSSCFMYLQKELYHLPPISTYLIIVIVEPNDFVTTIFFIDTHFKVFRAARRLRGNSQGNRSSKVDCLMGHRAMIIWLFDRFLVLRLNFEVKRGLSNEHRAMIIKLFARLRVLHLNFEAKSPALQFLILAVDCRACYSRFLCNIGHAVFEPAWCRYEQKNLTVCYDCQIIFEVVAASVRFSFLCS